MMLERELAELMEGTSDAAFAVDLQGEIRTWNKAAEKLFGYPASLAIGKSCAAVVGGSIGIDEPICREPCDILECVRNGTEIKNYDMQIKTALGQLVWVNVSLLVATDGRTERRLVVHLMRDIAARKKTELLTSRIMRMAKDLVNGKEEPNALPPIFPVTTQERKILHLLASGKSTTEVTVELQISLPTLRNHLYHINQKLHTKSRIEAVIQALKRGLI
jgi:PAS domain S-box-containing protein